MLQVANDSRLFGREENVSHKNGQLKTAVILVLVPDERAREVG